jgi:O-acetyl-ADP-ribose deacetylase (regulator of RNase III)
MKVKINQTILELLQGDITELDTDAIVNPANQMLQLGGGVAGAIRRKGGPSIQDECNQIGPINVGEAVITSGGNLNAKYVIHAVGPKRGEHHEDEKLKNATLNPLFLANKHNLESIAFPAISTGVFGFPKDRCAIIMLSTTTTYLEGPTSIKRVVFCLFDQSTLDIFKNTLKTLITPS